MIAAPDGPAPATAMRPAAPAACSRVLISSMGEVTAAARPPLRLPLKICDSSAARRQGQQARSRRPHECCLRCRTTYVPAVLVQLWELQNAHLSYLMHALPLTFISSDGLVSPHRAALMGVYRPRRAPA